MLGHAITLVLLSMTRSVAVQTVGVCLPSSAADLEEVARGICLAEEDRKCGRA